MRGIADSASRSDPGTTYRSRSRPNPCRCNEEKPALNGMEDGVQVARGPTTMVKTHNPATRCLLPAEIRTLATSIGSSEIDPKRKCACRRSGTPGLWASLIRSLRSNHCCVSVRQGDDVRVAKAHVLHQCPAFVRRELGPIDGLQQHVEAGEQAARFAPRSRQ